MKQIVRRGDLDNKIFTVRGVQVMLDRDLAVSYKIKNIRLREQVKRNIKRFPNDFMFKLTNSEIEYMVSQNAIPSKKHLGGHKPYVFTEQGIASLSSVLRSDVAVDVHIQIMRAFVQMRKLITHNAEVFSRIERLELGHNAHTEQIDTILNALEDKSIKPKQGIFYDGQIFDAYLFDN